MAKVAAFPEVLYKAFPCREHAELFRDGCIRFSTLWYYKHHEDGARADSTEGTGLVQLKIDDPRNDRTESVAPQERVENLRIEAPDRECFICCFSLLDDGDPSVLSNRFGRFYVKINRPEQLFRDIEHALGKDPLLQQEPPILEAGSVRYDKGRYVGSLINPEEIKKLPWLQKPAYYSEENEYRLHFRCGAMEPCDNYTVDIGRKLAYCDIFECT